MFLEIIKFIIYSGLIVIISKYILVTTLRKLAENLNLKAKTVGNIAGYATSVPELLTIVTASLSGLTGTSIYNILSSNVINLIQYLGAGILNKNISKLKNKAIIIDLILVIITILIPIFMIKANISLNIIIVPIFIFLYIIFRIINDKTHKKYLEFKEEVDDDSQKNTLIKTRNKKDVILNIVVLILTGIVLFFVGELLGNTLENLCNTFGISEVIIGILLGFITSLPELITFFEAQRHHKNAENDMLGVVEATNNLLTSNILNLFVIESIGILLISFK